MKTKASDSMFNVRSSGDYVALVEDISSLLDQAKRTTVKVANDIITTTYWQVGRRIIEFEQGGKVRAEYGERVLSKLSTDLLSRHGRGYSARNLRQMRAFYLGWEIWQTPSAKLQARVKIPTKSEASSPGFIPPLAGESVICQTLSAKSQSGTFPLSWSQYVSLTSKDTQGQATCSKHSPSQGDFESRACGTREDREEDQSNVAAFSSR